MEGIHTNDPTGGTETILLMGHRTGQERTSPTVQHGCEDRYTVHECPLFQESQPRISGLEVISPICLHTHSN